MPRHAEMNDFFGKPPEAGLWGYHLQRATLPDTIAHIGKRYLFTLPQAPGPDNGKALTPIPVSVLQAYQLLDKVYELGKPVEQGASLPFYLGNCNSFGLSEAQYRGGTCQLLKWGLLECRDPATVQAGYVMTGHLPSRESVELAAATLEPYTVSLTSLQATILKELITHGYPVGEGNRFPSANALGKTSGLTRKHWDYVYRELASATGKNGLPLIVRQNQKKPWEVNTKALDPKNQHEPLVWNEPLMPVDAKRILKQAVYNLEHCLEQHEEAFHNPERRVG
jgi:hypothetical protein